MELEVALDPVKAAPSSASTASKDLFVAKANLPIWNNMGKNAYQPLQI